MPPANATGLLFHVYATPGNHEVSISGGLKSINLGANPVSAAKLQSIDQWGNITWTNMKMHLKVPKTWSTMPATRPTSQGSPI